MAKQCVIDANATLGLFLRLPYSESIDRQMLLWQGEETRLLVPTLWEYECITGLRRAVAIQLITAEVAERMTVDLFSLEFQRVAPTLALHQAAFHWAGRIGQSKIYDAHYLALAESLSAEFWTADQRLLHTAQRLGVDWVHAI